VIAAIAYTVPATQNPGGFERHAPESIDGG
jgi:hypothetical protein